MSAADILLFQQMIPLVERKLDANFSVHRLYEADDEAGFLARIGAQIRGISMFGKPIDASVLKAFPNLEIIASYGVGYDNIDAAACAAHGVMVTNTPDVLTDEVADVALGLLLMTVRELSSAERWLRAGKWEGTGPYPLTRTTLQGRTLGIFGLGRIGKAIAKRAESFGLKICYCGRTRQPDVPYPYFATLTELAEACDTLMIAAPGGAGTHHAVNGEVLRALGPDGLLINIGRGSSVDENALIAALEAGTILGAGLDVFEDEPKVPQPLKELDRVVLLPHVASASKATRDAMGQLVVDNLISWFETGKPLTPVAEML